MVTSSLVVLFTQLVDLVCGQGIFGCSKLWLGMLVVGRKYVVTQMCGNAMVHKNVMLKMLCYVSSWFLFLDLRNERNESV